jgi:5-methyltetrahydropteroyltriglutamate--homocysteine methyltransferase
MIVGSLPRPVWLADPQQQRVYTSHRLEGDALREAQDDAVLLALRDQEIAGLDIVTDGEQRRRHYIWGFCEALEGLDFEHLVKLETRGNRYGVLVDAARVVGPVRRPRPVFREALRFLKSHTTKPVKMTLPGPMTTADTLADEHYGSRRALAADLAKVLNDEACELAEAGCDIVQFDEPCFNIYLDDVEEWGIRTLEQAATGVRAKTAVHICYGYGIPVVLEWKSRNQDWSHYGRTLPLLRTSVIDQISVECAASGVDPSVLALARGRDARDRRQANPHRARARPSGPSVPMHRLRHGPAGASRGPRQDESARGRRADRPRRPLKSARDQGSTKISFAWSVSMYSVTRAILSPRNSKTK